LHHEFQSLEKARDFAYLNNSTIKNLRFVYYFIRYCCCNRSIILKKFFLREYENQIKLLFYLFVPIATQLERNDIQSSFGHMALAGVRDLKAATLPNSDCQTDAMAR